MHTSTHTVLYDPDGLIEGELPLDCEPYECLVTAVLAWTGEDTLTTRDLEQIALQLTGHARAVASDVRRRANQLPKDSGPGRSPTSSCAKRKAGCPRRWRAPCAASRTAPASSAPSTNAWTAWRPRRPRPSEGATPNRVSPLTCHFAPHLASRGGVAPPCCSHTYGHRWRSCRLGS
ncbi:hypothetical protein ACVWXU_000062 [Streptomyces sp. TE33382]